MFRSSVVLTYILEIIEVCVCAQFQIFWKVDSVHVDVALTVPLILDSGN